MGESVVAGNYKQRAGAIQPVSLFGAIPGCATQGDTYEELIANLHEAIEACLTLTAN